MPKTLSVQFGALWVLVLTIWTAEGALERICDASTIRAGPVRGDRCGRNLSTILRDLCNPHGYYSVDPQKRSQSPRHKTTSARLPTGRSPTNMTPMIPPIPSLSYPFFSKSQIPPIPWSRLYRTHSSVKVRYLLFRGPVSIVPILQ